MSSVDDRSSKRAKTEESRADRTIALEDLVDTRMEDELNDPAYASMEQAALLKEMERRKRAREIAVPTDDRQIRAKLRELQEPQCLFGEGPSDRRDRLRNLLSRLPSRPSRRVGGEGDEIDEDEYMESDEGSEMGEAGEGYEEEEEEFYIPGSEALLEARKDMTRYSLPRTMERIKKEKEETKVSLASLRTTRNTAWKQLKSYANLASQLGDDRAVAQCAFSPDGQMIATGGWSGLARLWSVPMCEPRGVLNGHTDRIGGVAWHPRATVDLPKSVVNLATSGAEGNISLWNLEGEEDKGPMAQLKGHIHRVCRVAFHPSGKYLGSASFDQTWRLWDVERQEELLLQEGHAAEVFSIAFQGDGALVATAGLDKIGRVWDTRSGRSAMTLQGHAGAVYALDWSPNGHQVATGSADNTIRVWDVRKLSTLQTIAAHTNVVSDVKYYRGEGGDGDLGSPGLWLLSGSYDGTVRTWSDRDWRLVKSWTGHEGKVMGVDVSRDGKFLASTGFDRTFKLWAHEDTVV